MASHVEGPERARLSLPDEVRHTANALALLLEKAAATPPARAAVKAACDAVRDRLGDPRLTLALVGDPGAGRRTLINALLGDRVLPASRPRRGLTFTLVRRAAALEFTATSSDGLQVARLSRKAPDREALFDKSMAQIDRDRAAVEALADRVQAARRCDQATETDAREGVDATLEAASSTALARVPERPAIVRWQEEVARLWRLVWSWILHLFLRSPRPAIGPAASPGTSRAAQREQERAELATLERELAGYPSLQELAARAERLGLERRKYEEERRSAFLAQVRAFDGTDIGERVVEYPAKHLPDGVTLMDLPCMPVARAPAMAQIQSRVAREVDALVVVADVARPPGEATAALVRELGALAPVLLVVLTKADGSLLAAAPDAGDLSSRMESVRRAAFTRVADALDGEVRGAHAVLVAAEDALPGAASDSPLADRFQASMAALFGRLAADRPVVTAWREAMRLRTTVADLSRANERDEVSCQKRLFALESRRFPDPAEFRAEPLTRLAGATEKGAAEVLAAAVEGLGRIIEGLRAEWKARIGACTTRGEVDACIAAISEGAQARMAAAFEQTAEIVARELHEVTETLERSALEEIHGQYRLVRQLDAEDLAPVASELTREDLEYELQTAQAFEGAMAAFEKKRVGYGLGGAAAGSALGTLIMPGVGTAIGAVLGVFAGFLKGTESLKQECIAKIEAYLNEAAGHAEVQLRSREADLSRIIRGSIDEALEEAFDRLHGAITRLIAVERKAIDRERAKLTELSAARHALQRCDERLARVIETAASRGDA